MSEVWKYAGHRETFNKGKLMAGVLAPKTQVKCVACGMKFKLGQSTGDQPLWSVLVGASLFGDRWVCCISLAQWHQVTRRASPQQTSALDFGDDRI